MSDSCPGCIALKMHILKLQEENAKLIEAIQRESHHMEDRRIHHKDEISDMRKWLKRE